MDCKLQHREGCQEMPMWADTISLDGGDLRITFRRTIRVADSSTSESLLPPDLGVFPLFQAKETRCWEMSNGTEIAFPSQVPGWLKAKGGIFFPMHENEATWINFESKSRRPYIIKVHAGGINAVSGLASTADTAPGQQDYVVIPEQRWLDGIAVNAGLVRQFVAVPLGKNRTVEGQITGSEKFGGIQFEVVKGIVWKNFYVQRLDGICIMVSVDDREHVDGLCRKISETLGETLGPRDLYEMGRMVRLERVIDESLRETGLTDIGIVDPENLSLLEELDKNEQYLYGTQFPGWGYAGYASAGYADATPTRAGSQAEFGLAAGGLIKQHIQKDTHPASTWDFATKTVFNVQLISAQVFKEMTGFMTPTGPINAATYRMYGLPFYEIPESPSTVAGDFGRLKSLAHLKYMEWIDNDVVLAPASDIGEFRSINGERQEEGARGLRLTSAQTTTKDNWMRRRAVSKTEICDSRSQEDSTRVKSLQRAYHVSSTKSQEDSNARQSDDFYPDFDDEVEEIPGLPFGSSARDVWSRIYSEGS